MSPRSRSRILAAILLLALVGVGIGFAATAMPAADTTTVDSPDGVSLDEIEETPSGDGYEVAIPEELKETDDGEAVLLLSIERDIDSEVLTEGQVDAATLQADSETTLEPVTAQIDGMAAAEVRNAYWVGNIISVQVDLGVHDVEEFAEIDGVTAVSPNLELRHPTPAGEDGAVGVEDSHGYTYGLQQIDVPGFEAEFNDRGGNATVAIIDDGISSPEEGHPDLDFETKAVAENGEVTTGTLGDPGSHGEHTAGTATGAANPAGDVPRYGVAPEAGLMMINTFQGSAAAEDSLAAVQFAAEQGADVASMSLGFPVQTPGNSVLELLMEQQIRDANAMGTLVIGSAGNEGSGDVGGPATSPGAEFTGFSIGASDSDRNIAPFSSGAIINPHNVDYVPVGGGTEFPAYYPYEYVKPDVSAPGAAVLSAGPLGGDIGDPAAAYSYSSGTSMAAPHVAGAVALVQSATSQELHPKLIESALAETAEKPANDFPALNGRDIRYGTGIINVTAATMAIQDGTLEIEGQVTDTEGEPIAGATVETDAGALTSTNATGHYTLWTAGESVEVTANGFGYTPQTKTVGGGPAPESGHGALDFQLQDQLGVDDTPVQDQPFFAPFGGEFEIQLSARNLEAYTPRLTEATTVSEENITILFNDVVAEFGQPLATDFDGVATVTVDIADDANLEEGDIVQIEHTFEGPNSDPITLATRGTNMTEEVGPPEFEAVDFEGGPNAVGDLQPLTGYSAEMTVTNVGQQTGQVRFDWFLGQLGLQGPPEAIVNPGETVTRSFNLADVSPVFIDVLVSDQPAIVSHGFDAANLDTEEFEDTISERFTVYNEFGPEFSINSTDIPISAGTGETVSVGADIENLGIAGDEQQVTFTLGGEQVASQSVSLDGATESEGNFSFDATNVTVQAELPDQAGVYEYSLSTGDDTVSGTIAVGNAIPVTFVTSEADGFAADTAGLAEPHLPDWTKTTVLESGEVTQEVINRTEVFVFYDIAQADAESLITSVEADDATGAVYLDQWGEDGNAIPLRSEILGDPASTDQAINSSGGPIQYEIRESHPIFDGVGQAGDTVTIHAGSFFNDHSWFEGASGDTLAEVVEPFNGTGGPAVAEDPNNNTVLMSSIAVGAISADQYTPEAGRMLANAIEYIGPDVDEPEIGISDLDIAGQGDYAIVEGGSAAVTVNVTQSSGDARPIRVTRTVGGTTDSTWATLGAGQSETITFPSEAPSPGVYDVSATAFGGQATGTLLVPVDVTGDGNVSTDTTGDGLLNDVDGDGEFTILDIQALFAHYESNTMQDNYRMFDFAGTGSLSIFDVQALWNQYQAQSAPAT